ncbi:MAG: electron transport complex subunit RsxC [Gammaproteobacteria bacterium]|nr:MAG: electron transport complex subunit RsxC [Gammaproteobacteria bacterium]
MRKIWDLVGGVHPPENKHQSVQQPIGRLPLPDKLVIPLNQHIGAPPKLLVSSGDRVLKGQALAEPNGMVSVGVHAPTSGTITDISDYPIPHPSGMSARCITLEPDGEDCWIEHSGVDNYRDYSPAKLLELIREAGIAGLGGAGFPSAVKLSARKPISTLIINGTECEPYITADDMLMREHAREIVEGIQMLAYILGEPEEILIGIEDNKPEAYEALEPLLAETNIELVEFPTRYPSGGEKQLIQILTGKEVPSGGLPADIGIVCQNIGTTYAIQRAICEGEPLIERVTTVTGRACTINRNYRTLIGTPISHLLRHNGFDQAHCARLIMGGPMMGFTLTDPDVPVIKTTNCILAPSKEEMPAPPPAQACIRCGMCAEACPASLLPQQMFWYAQSENYERLEAHNLFDCIECGACSYVCPSNIPLVQYYRAAKGEIRKQAQEKIKSDRARARFEFQQARKAKEEAEKVAKREARKKAAEQARALAADKPGGDQAAGGAEDIVKAAMARAAQKQASPEEQKAKLERGIARAESHLQTVEHRLQTAQQEGSEQQIEQARAAVEDARVRLEDARAKLAALGDGSAPADKVMARVQASTTEALQKKITSLKERIAVTEQKIAEADDDSLKAALQSGLDKQRNKLQEAEQQLAETPAEAATETPAATTDAAAAAIARAQARAAAMDSMSEADKLRESIISLEGRIEKAKAKLDEARASESEHVDALQAGLDKLQKKLLDAREKCAAFAGQPQAPCATAPETPQQAPQSQDAASAAIARAQARAVELANMSEEDKLRETVTSLQSRLKKARQKLRDAEAEGSEHVDALRTAAEKLDAKLAAAEQQLAEYHS